MFESEWEDFYKRSPDRFIEEFLGIKLKWHQRALLRVWSDSGRKCRKTKEITMEELEEIYGCKVKIVK